MIAVEVLTETRPRHLKPNHRREMSRWRDLVCCLRCLRLEAKLNLIGLCGVI